MCKPIFSLHNLCSIAVKLLALGSFLVIANAAQADVCWKDTYGRGVGLIPGECNSLSEDKSGLLCYPKCKPGYTIVAGVCWQQCPAGFTDTGAHCLKPGSYGRGEYSNTWASWNQSKCEEQARSQGKAGCDKSGALWYHKCKENFHAVGCCVCSPNCPAGMKDIGVSCQKDSYVVRPITPTCGAKQYDAGLCYNQCGPKFYGVGPVCWGNCPADKPVDCGAMCGTSVQDCVSSIGEMVMSVGSVAAKIAGAIATFGGSTAGQMASEAAIKTAINGLKDAAKKVAKDIAKKLGSLAAAQVKQRIAQELVKLKGLPQPMADKLAEMTADPEAFDYKSFLIGIDPTGIGKVVESFRLPICNK